MASLWGASLWGASLWGVAVAVLLGSGEVGVEVFWGEGPLNWTSSSAKTWAG